MADEEVRAGFLRRTLSERVIGLAIEVHRHLGPAMESREMPVL
jgi:hypothetical protein